MKQDAFPRRGTVVNTLGKLLCKCKKSASEKIFTIKSTDFGNILLLLQP